MTHRETSPLQIAARVCATLNEHGLAYSIGGSIASSFAGEPRMSVDIDIVVAVDVTDIQPLVAALEDDFYIEPLALERAIRNRSTANIIHRETSLKVDLFVAGGTALDDSLLHRRLPITTAEADAPLYIHTPEDILLQKLRWYQLGGEVSDRQWRDVLGIIRVQGSRLDQGYLADGASRLHVDDLLVRALREGTVTP